MVRLTASRLLTVLALTAILSHAHAQDAPTEQAQPAGQNSSAVEPVDPPLPSEVEAQAESSAELDDAEARIRVRRALESLEGLRDLRVEVDGGTATIHGIATDTALIRRVTELAEGVEGVSAVESRIELTDDVGERIEGATARVQSRIKPWLAYLPLLPIAGIIVAVGVVVAWLIGAWRWPYRKIARNPFLADILRRIVQMVVFIASVLLALDVLDATALVGGVLGAAGVAGIAIGFAFRDLVENYIASILLSVRQPFRPRDHVVIDGHEGLVTRLTTRTTVLTTFDGNLVRIPNATVFKSAITNYTQAPNRRFEFTVGVGYDVDLSGARAVGVRVLTETEGVLPDPGPFVIVTQLGDSAITLRFFAWVDQRSHDFGRVKSAAMQRVKEEYDRLDIDMPEPIYSVKMLEPKAKPAAEPPGGLKPSPATEHEIASAERTTADDTITQMVEDERARQPEDDLLSPEAPVE